MLYLSPWTSREDESVVLLEDGVQGVFDCVCLLLAIPNLHSDIGVGLVLTAANREHRVCVRQVLEGGVRYTQKQDGNKKRMLR